MEVDILFGAKAQDSLYVGIKEITDAVASTLGPKGHTVMIDRGYGIPHITKDGVTVARSYDTNDAVKRMGAALVKTVAAKTCDEAGDGTTTATILTEALIKDGMRNSYFISSPHKFREGMEYGCKIAVEYFKSVSTNILPNDFDKISQIATISANGDKEIGTIITEAISQVGNDGVIAVEESSSDETYVTVTTGFQWEKGLINPYFVTNPERIECTLERPYVMVVSQNLNDPQEIFSAVQMVYTAKRSLLIIAPSASNEVIKFLVTNIQQANGLKACFVKAPGYGQIQKDLLEDLALKVGAKNINDGTSFTFEKFGTDWLGECDRVTVSSNKTILVGGKGSDEDIELRVKTIKNQMSDTANTYDVEKYRERISKLTGGAAVIYVGAKSEVEMKERKDRADDAIAATRAAIEEGYIPGGGTIQFRASEVIMSKISENNDIDFYKGMETVATALTSILKQLCINAGVKPEKIENKFFLHTLFQFGFNPFSNKIEDMFLLGVIDPVKVARVSLENAVSVAVQFLNTSCVMATENKKE